MKNVVVVLLLILTSSLVACSTPDEETLIRKALRGLIEGVEEQSFFQVKKYISEDFKSNRFRNIQQLKAYMLVYYQQNKVIKIFHSNVQIILQKDKADVTFNTLVTGSSNWVPERGRLFKVQSRWLKQDGDWKISRVNWQEVTGFN